ncbi:MAG TPA: M23 family metallopeptidase, partial [Spirochaetales bacterium]|nr:M23 family metallopeptidase [Spirochaetales bacterium]
LQHGSFTVSYCHLSQIFVSQGQDVLSGDVVGITGNTGRSTGEHLHITIRQKGEYVNPRIFLDYINSVKESCVMEFVKNII